MKDRENKRKNKYTAEQNYSICTCILILKCRHVREMSREMQTDDSVSRNSASVVASAVDSFTVVILFR